MGVPAGSLPGKSLNAKDRVAVGTARTKLADNANICNGDGALKKQGFNRISYPVGRRESYAYEI